MPERVRISRQHPWRHLHPDAVIVDRKTAFGNPYKVRQTPDGWVVSIYSDDVAVYNDRTAALLEAVKRFRRAVEFGWHGLAEDLIRAELRGRDLACWCAPDQPCHADVLLELANGGA